MDLDRIIAKVPDYKTFLTVDEMDESTRQLEREFAGVVSVFEVGKSRKGHPILCIKIGDGPKNALVFACPHPNEPIGVMTCEFLTRTLAEDKALRDELGYTWYFIKCVDPDGVRLNEKWFKGPFNLYNYSRYFYRPVGYEQVEWTFPIDYKELHFHSPLPETQALMKIMEEQKPSFVYSLHNAGFGGAYWYITKDIPEIYSALYRAAEKQDVPRHLGEPEAPFCEQLAPAVYRMMGAEDSYDFTEKFTGKPPAVLNMGTSSGDYALSQNPDSVTFLTELPYFYDPRIEDMSPGDMSRREAVLASAQASEAHTKLVSGILEPMRQYISPENPFVKLIDQMIAMSAQSIQSKKAWAMSDPEFEKPATVASIFDNLLVGKFYQGLTIGLSARTCEFELERMSKEDGEAVKVLEKARDQALELLKTQSEELEREMNYSVIDIKRLVSVQAECGLIVARAVSKES